MGTFVQDSFTDTDSTLLQNHTGEIGATWTKHPTYSGDLTISGNKITPVASLGYYLASGLPTSVDQVIAADISRAVGSGAGKVALCGRASATAYEFYSAYLTTLGVLYLSKRVNGVTTILGSYSVAVGEGVTARIKLEITDALKRVLVDGVERISSTDNEITAAGRVGIEAYNSDGSILSFDNFQADDLVVVTTLHDTKVAVSTSVQTLHDTLAAVSTSVQTLHDTILRAWPPGTRFFHPGGVVVFARNCRRPRPGLRLWQPEAQSAIGKRFGYGPAATEEPLTLHWPMMSSVDLASLRSFFETIGGMAETFFLVLPDGRIFTVRFAEPAIAAVERAHDAHEVTLTLLKA